VVMAVSSQMQMACTWWFIRWYMIKAQNDWPARPSRPVTESSDANFADKRSPLRTKIQI